MVFPRKWPAWAGALLCLTWFAGIAGAATLRVATYNLNNYLDAPVGKRPAKPEVARDAVQSALHELNADVIALQEMGSSNSLYGLQQALLERGLSYPQTEWVSGWDTNIHLALLSRFPIATRRFHTNQSFTLFGRQYRVRRGFGEFEIVRDSKFRFTLLLAHLKSRLDTYEADEVELREAEARVLRTRIEECFRLNPAVHLVVLGDLNDTPDSRTLRIIRGRPPWQLVDSCPAERPDPRLPGLLEGSTPVTWTYHYAKADSYQRIDYILLSDTMARLWVREGTWILRRPDWGCGSDHRPIVAEFAVPGR